MIHESEAARLVLELMHLLAHDLKNPIGAALANLGFAEQADGADPELPGALRDATSAVRRVLQIVNDVTIAAQHEARQLKIAKQPTSAEELVVAVASTDARSGGIEVACPAGLSVLADAPLLRRALEALVEASMRWGGSRGKLLVGARKEAQHAVFFVCHDSPFEREPRLMAAASQGADAAPAAIGLALYFARSIALAHGGTLVVRKTEVWGTEIAIEIP